MDAIREKIRGKSIDIPYNFKESVREFQKEVLADSRRNKVLVIHRRGGKTALALNKLIIEAVSNADKVYWYVCPTMKQAKEIVWRAPDMLNKFIPDLALGKKVVLEKKNEVECSLFFTNGSQIWIKGADNPDSLRGMNPYGVVLDESGDMDAEVYEILSPVLAANGGWIWFIGTPKGKNWFYKMYNFACENKEWHAVMVKASTSGIIPKEGLENSKKEMTETFFKQEYECLFADGAGQVFRRIGEAVDGRIWMEPRRGRYYKLGVDLAKYTDFTVITVVDLCTLETVFIDRFNQLDWSLQKARIEAIARRYADLHGNPASITIDASGIGDPSAEDLISIGLNIDTFKFTNTSKKKLVENFAILLENDKIKIPRNQLLIQELEQFSYTITSEGRVKYNAPQGLHDDCFVKGTKILTDKGQVPIETIKIGDMVMTRNGLRKVLTTRSKYKKVIKHLGLIGTPTHPVITIKGIKDLANINETDMLYIWNEKLSSIEEKNIIDTQSQKEDNLKFTSGDMTNGKNHHSHFIARCGLMSLVKYLKEMLSIIKTAILSITRLRTWNVSKRDIIYQDICCQKKEENSLLKMEKNNFQNYLKEVENGEQRQKQKSFLEKTYTGVYTIKNLGKRIVGFVKKNLPIFLKDIAIFAIDFVVLISTKKRRVYNFQVSDTEEYFANNILVHNCVISICLAYWGVTEPMQPEVDTRLGLAMRKYNDPFVKAFNGNPSGLNTKTY